MGRKTMTAPRYVAPGTTWMVTRRITRRHCLLRPDADGTLQRLYWYFTAVVAQQLGVQVHVVQLLSNHMHELLTDTRGVLPRFLELRNRLLANAIKCHRGWPEEVFSRTPANWVQLPSPAAFVKEAGYVIANCVSACLVRTPRRWPGVKVLVDEIGRRVVRVERPDVYLDQSNPQWPEVAELALTMPPMLEHAHGGTAAARRALQQSVDDWVSAAHAEARRLGRAFKGAKRVLRTPFAARASSYEPFGGRSPRFSAAGDPVVAAASVQRHRGFIASHRAKWHAWRRGAHDVLFPYGTWKMRIQYGVRTEPPPD